MKYSATCAPTPGQVSGRGANKIAQQPCGAEFHHKGLRRKVQDALCSSELQNKMSDLVHEMWYTAQNT